MTGKRKPIQKRLAPDEPDDENPEWTAEDFARAIPHIGGKPVTMEEFRAAHAARMGRPKTENPKRSVTLRLDADVVEHFRGTGDGWQTRINATLRKAAKLPAAPSVPMRRTAAANPTPARKTRQRQA